MNTLAEKLNASQSTWMQASTLPPPPLGELGYIIQDESGLSTWISKKAYDTIINHNIAEHKAKSPVKALRNVYDEVRRDAINNMTEDKPDFIRVSGGEHCIPDDYFAAELFNGITTEHVYQLLKKDK